MTGIPKRRALFPPVLALALLAFTVSVLVCCLLAIRGSHAQRCDQSCWVELRESAVKNKQKLARLLLTDSTSVANTRTAIFEQKTRTLAYSKFENK